MNVWKRNAVVAVIVLFVCAAVYLNWSYNQETADAGKVLGQAALVGAESTDPLLAGGSAAAAQFAITAAYRYAPAKELSVFDYSQVLFSAIFGFLLFDQVPDALSWAGYLIIFGTAVAMFLKDRKAPA